jgi:hypothetical protein
MHRMILSIFSLPPAIFCGAVTVGRFLHGIAAFLPGPGAVFLFL